MFFGLINAGFCSPQNTRIKFKSPNWQLNATQARNGLTNNQQ
jgi:hypothetical protein